MTKTISIALIGNDGSGKSTIARKLLDESQYKLKYIYMGVSIESSNYALPWSKIVNWIKKRNIRKQAQEKGISDPAYLTIHHLDHRRRKTGNLRTLFRVINRLTEGVYRLIIAFIFRARGYSILFDRYFLYEAAPAIQDGVQSKMHPLEDAYFRFWRDIVPKPTVTIFLDGPAEILLARKGEGDEGYFNEKRKAWLYIGQQLEHFCVVDATQSVDRVYEQVVSIIDNVLRQ